jgi:hypothetical protein
VGEETVNSKAIVYNIQCEYNLAVYWSKMIIFSPERKGLIRSEKKCSALTPSEGSRSTGCTQNLVSLQQQSYRDTTTNNEGKDDDKMDVCGPEERKGSSGSLPAADDTDWFEGSQV